MSFKQTALRIASEVESANGIDLDEVVSRLKVEWKHDRINFEEAFLRNRATIVLCTAGYYSTGESVFQRFEEMSDEDQRKVLAKLQKTGETYRQTCVRLSKCMKGQIVMEFKEDGSFELKEVV